MLEGTSIVLRRKAREAFTWIYKGNKCLTVCFETVRHSLSVDLQRQQLFTFCFKTPGANFQALSVLHCRELGYRRMILTRVNVEKIFSRHNCVQMLYNKVYPYGQANDAFPGEQRIVLSLQTMPALHCFPPLWRKKNRKTSMKAVVDGRLLTMRNFHLPARW